MTLVAVFKFYWILSIIIVFNRIIWLNLIWHLKEYPSQIFHKKLFRRINVPFVLMLGAMELLIRLALVTEKYKRIRWWRGCGWSSGFASVTTGCPNNQLKQETSQYCCILIGDLEMLTNQPCLLGVYQFNAKQ